MLSAGRDQEAENPNAGLPFALCPLRATVAEHRGMAPWERALYARALERFSSYPTWGDSTNFLVGGLRRGEIPFAKCRNPQDGNKMWGRYYTAPEFSPSGMEIVTTKRLPKKKRGVVGGAIRLVNSAVDTVDDVKDWVVETLETYEKIGGALLSQFGGIIRDPQAFLETVAEAFKLGICKMLDADWKRRLLLAGAIAAGAPPTIAELLIKIAKALCDLLKIIAAPVSKTVKMIAALAITAKLVI